MTNKKQNNYVSAKPERKTTPMPLTELEIVSENKNLPDYRNRSVGFLIWHVPYFIFVAITFLVMRKYFFDSPIFTLTSLVYFCIIVSGLWTISYISHFVIASEFNSLIETVYKWRMINTEHKTRWDYYKNINFD